LRRSAVAFALLFAFLTARPAAATTATDQQVRDLATRAESDPGALDQLRKVDVVDGRSVDLSHALDTSSTAELDARLRTIARGAAPVAASTVQDRDAAREILSGRRYRTSALPRPFAGLLDRIGRFLTKLWHPIGRHLPHLGPLWWIGVGALVVAAAIVVTFVLGLRRRAVSAEHVAIARVRSLRPDDLERAARDAEAAGRLAEAIRLRFAAGLVRLDRAGVIEWHPSITSGAVRRRLRSETFDNVASSFERVTYGDRAPTSSDVELSRSGWRDVMERVR
jgi:hypothetical protein